MGNASKGAKAGVIAGLPYGFIIAGLLYLFFVSNRDAMIATLVSSVPANGQFTIDQLYGLVLVTAPIIAVILGVVGGVILGLIFGWLFEKVPWGSAIRKGVFFGIVLGVIASFSGLGNLLSYPGFYLVYLGVGLSTSVFFGALLGFLYGRFTALRTVDQ